MPIGVSVPSFSLFGGCTMSNEMRLVAAGIPLEDAVMICFAMRKSGGLEEFIRQEEEKAKDRVDALSKASGKGLDRNGI